MLDAIRFVGNKVTRASILRQEMRVRVGESCTPEQIEESRQAIMNLGLFKSVQAKLMQEEGENILEVRVEERFYILPIPLVDYRPGFLADETATNYTYGGQLRFDNLFGLNQRLKLEYERKEYEDEAEPSVREWNLAFTYPRIVGTPYRLELEAKHEQKNTEQYDEGSGQYLGTAHRKVSIGRVFFSRWLNPKGFSKGWYAGAGVKGSANRYRDVEGQTDYESNNVVELLGKIGYYQVDQHPYHREGEAYSYSVELAHQAFGSDWRYVRNTFEYRQYRPVRDLNANVNTRLLVGLAFGDGDAYSLGSSSTLRGTDKNVLTGDLVLLGNMEYHHRLSGYQQLRGVVFVDVGNVWPEVGNIEDRRLYSSIGIGARWRVQSFVDVTLRLDYAYNTDSGERETYFSTSGSF